MRILKQLIGSVALLAMAANVRAIPVLTLSDGLHTASFSSAGGSPLAPSGLHLGNWCLRTAAADGPPELGYGTALLPDLALAYAVRFNGGSFAGPSDGKTLTVTFTDDTLGPTLGNLASLLAGSMRGGMTSTELKVWHDDPIPANTLADLLFANTATSFNGEVPTSLLALPGSYSLSLELIFCADTAGSAAGGAEVSLTQLPKPLPQRADPAVPECCPTAALLLLGGMANMAAARKLRKVP